MWSASSEWAPKTGIRLFKADANVLQPIKNSLFRIASLNLDKVFGDVMTKYVPVLPEEQQSGVRDCWLKFRERIDKLPSRIFPVMKIDDLKNKISELPVSKDIDNWRNQQSEREPNPIVGAIIPAELLEGSFQVDAEPGMDACVWTLSKKDRPWLIRVKEVFKESNMFEGVWLKRGRGKNSYVLDVDSKGHENCANLSMDTVLLFGFSTNITPDGCKITDYWLNKLRDSYRDHDETYN